MIITNINAGAKASFSASGTSLTIGTVTIDLQARQAEEQKVIDICLDNQLKTMAEGLGAWYVAHVIIPPIQKHTVDSGQQDSNGNEIFTEESLPLNMDDVEIRLWGLPQNYGQTTEGGTN